MPIKFIANDPLAGPAAPDLRSQTARKRPASRAGIKIVGTVKQSEYQPGTSEFVYWQCHEAALATLEAWEAVAGPLARWQGNRKLMPLRPDAGQDLNAYYDRTSFSFFHQTIGTRTFFSGASTDVVAHEVGHGLLDVIRPDLWDTPFLESNAFHEAFGDCLAILTALHDTETRKRLLKATKTLRKKNFVEGTAEELSDGIRRLDPQHNAAAPRRAFNAFAYQLPETLPGDGGPGALINEVHSFGMLFSGCFYDLIASIFAAGTSKTEGALLKAVQVAGQLLVRGTASAPITPRFFQSVGRAMVLADETHNGGKHRDLIGVAFAGHGILLGTSSMLAPTAALAGSAPSGTAKTISKATRADLIERLQAPPRAKLALSTAELGGQRFVSAAVTRSVELGELDRRLRGVTIKAEVPVLIGAQGARAAVIGRLPEPISMEREAQAFVASLLSHGQIELPKSRSARAAVSSAGVRPSAETHRVVEKGGEKVLQRVRFACCAGHRAALAKRAGDR